MKKFFFTSFFIFSLFIVGSISTLFIYPDRTQNFIVESFNLKTFLNKKVKYIISSKINDDNINVDIESLNILKPDWPNIAKIELKNINIYSLKQKRKSKIDSIELGLTYDKLLTNVFANKNEFQFSYIRFRDLTLNARIQKDKLLLGPLVKIFSLINKNKFQAQSYLQNILDNKIVIGKINLLLINDRNSQKKENLEINCENVTISKSINKSRYLDMDCNKGKNNLFSLRSNLNKDFNSFSGKVNNFNSNFFFDYWLKENFKFFKTSSHFGLNGSYNIKTKKNFSIQNINFVSQRSILTLENNKNEKILKTNFSGVFSWEKNKNLVQFNNVIIGDHLFASGDIDLISQKGTSNFSLQKISVEDTKNYLNEFFNHDHFPYKLNLNKISNNFRGGNLKNLKINLKFSLLEEFLVEEIVGTSNFSNTRFDYNDKDFKKLLSTISGNVDFKFKPQKLDDNIINVNLNANDGFILVNKDIQYKFNKAIVSGRLYKNDFLISKAEFFKNSELEYIFHNVRFSKDTLDIEKAEHIKEKKVQYIISDTTINNMNVKKCTLKLKNNAELSNFIKSKFDIEIIGDINLDFFLRGNLNNLNFNLKLNSNLKNSYLRIPYLDLIKKKNITSYIETEISMIKGKIAFLKNTNLNVESKTYKIGLVQFNKKNINKFLFKNLVTSDVNIDRMIILKNGNNLKIRASGKKIDLSSLNKNLKSKTNFNQDVVLDLTGDLIKLNSKISLIGSLKGEIKDSLFKSIAYGKLLLEGEALLDNGKFDLYSDSKISRLEGIGLIGGAETKINFQKQFNNFPSLIFDTSNGGKLLSALGFTQKIKSGKMKINIKFLNDKYDHYQGRIESKNFSLIDAPGIINSLSVLSFSGIRSIIIGEGVFFDKGEVNLEVKNKNFYFDKLYLTSESLGVAAKGSLNIDRNSINIRGSVAPIKLISKILSVVPAVGELLTGLKKEGLFAGQFEMKGSINNPEITLNKMSFAPGILREIFSEDWLDNNNFFMKKTAD